MLPTSLTTVLNHAPPIAPGIGGVVLTGVQAMSIVTNFAMETNPQTAAQYSKFAKKESETDEKMIGSRDGMTLIYLPAFVASSALYLFQGMTNLSFLPQKSLAGQFVIAHFLKRLLEVFFLHRYSGKVSQQLSLAIGMFYTLTSVLICYVAYPVTNNTNPSIPIVGSALFAIGLVGNFYHHYLLACLRDSKKTDGKRYSAPKGGLFNYVACPHYFFELVGWLGIAVVAQQMNAYLVFASMTSYLSGRAWSQNEWNRSKFNGNEWPLSRKNFVPFIF